MRTLAALVAVLLLAGCGGGGDRAGGSPARSAVVLTLANGNRGPGDLNAFADAVRSESHGALQIRIVSGLHAGDPRYETRIIGDVRADKADLGAVATRAWDSVGVRSFDALHAPLLLDSYRLQNAVLHDPVVTDMLGRLRPKGLNGVGVLPDELRRLAAVRRDTLAPGGLDGRAIAVQASPIAERSLAAAGARAVPIGSSGSIRGLDGVEQQLGALEGNHYARLAPYIAADVSLWARPTVVFAGPGVTEAQLAVLRRASGRSIGRMTALAVSHDLQSGRSLCNEGAHMVTADPAFLGELRRAAAPVYAALARDPDTSASLRTITAIKADLAAAPSDIAPCGGRQPTPSAAPTELDGLYAMASTRRQIARVAEPQDVVAENWGDFRILLAGGRLIATQENRQACTWIYGTYSVAGDVLAVHLLEGGGIAPNGATEVGDDVTQLRWSRYRGDLRLKPLNGLAGPVLAPQPWRRLGGPDADPGFPSRCRPPQRAYR